MIKLVEIKAVLDQILRTLEIKVALDQILCTFIKLVENKVACDQTGGN